MCSSATTFRPRSSNHCSPRTPKSFELHWKSCWWNRTASSDRHCRCWTRPKAGGLLSSHRQPVCEQAKMQHCIRPPGLARFPWSRVCRESLDRQVSQFSGLHPTTLRVTILFRGRCLIATKSFEQQWNAAFHLNGSATKTKCRA